MPRADYQKLFEKALLKIEEMPSGTVFLAKDPFEGFAWNSLDKGAKLGYGGFFKNKVMLGQAPKVKYIGKKDNNSAQYIKL